MKSPLIAKFREVSTTFSRLATTLEQSKCPESIAADFAEMLESFDEPLKVLVENINKVLDLAKEKLPRNNHGRRMDNWRTN